MFFSAFSFAGETESAVKLAQSKSQRLININSAEPAKLKTLPGITDEYAAKIIANRFYKKKEELKTRNIIPAAIYEKIKNKITVIDLT
jgi:DNA uptake protein ComE-like DNA-binding protein